MRHTFTLLLCMAMLAHCVGAWNTVAEMENEVCMALTNDAILLSATFTNNLHAAANSPFEEMRSEAHLLLAINAYQNFLNTMDEGWLHHEMLNTSNAVVAIGSHTDKWQYWMARFLHAGAFASLNDYMSSYATATNALNGLTASSYTNALSTVETCIMRKFEMTGIDISAAFKVFAGMSAAELGLGESATNYANQVPVPYRNTILEFIK